MKINYSNEKVIPSENSIFLAGPTPRDKETVSWRKEACQILEEKGFDGVVYVPEYSTWKPKESYVNQAMWEREALTGATIIVFWIPRKIPEMAGYTTNVEFGYWLPTGKVLYGRPENAPKTKYLDWLYEIDYQEQPKNNLEELLQEALQKLKIIGEEKKLIKNRKD